MSYRIGPPVSPKAQFNKPKSSTGEITAEMFEELLPCSWTPSKGGAAIYFPVISFKTSIRHDVVQHKYWGVDSGRIESTGRAPIEFEAEIPFVNGIVAAKNEKWSILYPDAFYAFLRGFANEKSGTLTHPELGEIFCRPMSLELSHEATTRDGVIVQAKWIESREDLSDTGLIATKDAPVKTAQLAALDLDASKDDLISKLPELPQADFSFDDAINKITGFVDSTTSTVSLLVSKPAQILNRVRTLSDAIDRSKNTALALDWKQKEAVSKLEDSVNSIRKGGATRTKVSSGRVVHATEDKPGLRPSKWLTPVSMTLAQVCSELGKIAGKCPDPKDVMELNPVFISRTRVGPGTVIFYYPA